MFKQSVENHYPITVLERQFSENAELNSALEKYILNFKSNNEDSNSSLSSNITTEKGYQTPLNYNLFADNHDTIQSFKDKIIMPAVQKYLELVFSEVSGQIDPWVVGWANILHDKSWQRPHFHPTQKNLISGVYYVTVPDDLESPDGEIEFINPMPISIHHGFSNSRRIKPQEGKLLLFPPFYMHYVHPLSSQGKRIIIAFDVLSESPNFKFVF